MSAVLYDGTEKCHSVTACGEAFEGSSATDVVSVCDCYDVCCTCADVCAGKLSCICACASDAVGFCCVCSLSSESISEMGCKY